jgi:SOS-response transcriptional repressor LexA
MNGITLSNNLQHLMRLHGNLSTSDLAKYTGIPQPTIHHILTGSTKKPREKALEALSTYFSVSIEQLTGKAPLPNIIPKSIKDNLQITTIPIIDWNILSSWPLAESNNLHSQEIVINKQIANNSFALIMKDESMEPMFPKNALLIFERREIPKDRDFVIIHRKGNNAVLFNRIFTENNENYLKQNSEDGNFNLIKLDKIADRIIGSLIEVRIEY